MIRSHTAKAIKTIAACTVLFFAAASAQAQSIPPANGQWDAGQPLGGKVAMIKPTCNVRLVYASSSPFYGSNVMRIPATRVRNVTSPAGSALPSSQMLEFDIGKNELSWLSITGLLATADYQTIESLYQGNDTAPYSLTIGVKLVAGSLPYTYILFPNKAAASKGDSAQLIKPSAMRLEQQCFGPQ